jgi:hypothetical protein
MTWATRKDQALIEAVGEHAAQHREARGGRAVAAWTQATKSTVGAMLVISQAAATDWIQTPKLDSSVAVQSRR